MLKINEHKNKRDKSKCFSKDKNRVSFRGVGGQSKSISGKSLQCYTYEDKELLVFTAVGKHTQSIEWYSIML